MPMKLFATTRSTAHATKLFRVREFLFGGLRVTKNKGRPKGVEKTHITVLHGLGFFLMFPPFLLNQADPKKRDKVGYRTLQCGL